MTFEGINPSDVAQAAQHVQNLIGSTPKVAIICGSGLSGLADALEGSKVTIPFEEIPNWAGTTVPGHHGKLVYGNIGTVPVICMVGRLHFYEGHAMEQTVFPVRVFALLGIKTLISTNAAGGLDHAFKVGDLMILSDHINLPGLAGNHPLRGPNDPTFGPRFLPLSDAYDLGLRKAFFKTAASLSIHRSVHEGTYAYVCGPTYETRAEARYLRTIGAQAVGMSTIPEVIVARWAGLEVLAISLITNVVVTDRMPRATDLLDNSITGAEGKASHSEVLEAAAEAANDIQRIVSELVRNNFA